MAPSRLAADRHAAPRRLHAQVLVADRVGGRRGGPVQAGAGIVADSVPAREYQESGNKARAVIKALEIAHDGGGESRGK